MQSVLSKLMDRARSGEVNEFIGCEKSSRKTPVLPNHRITFFPLAQLGNSIPPLPPLGSLFLS